MCTGRERFEWRESCRTFRQVAMQNKMDLSLGVGTTGRGTVSTVLDATHENLAGGNHGFRD